MHQLFNIGDSVRIRHDSDYASQIADTGGAYGTIVYIDNMGKEAYDDFNPLIDIWYDVKWPNGYENSYKSYHLEMDMSKVSTNKQAKTLLKGDYNAL